MVVAGTGMLRVFTMNSAVLGLAALGYGCCTLHGFRQMSQRFTLEDAIGSHAGSLEALACM